MKNYLLVGFLCCFTMCSFAQLAEPEKIDNIFAAYTKADTPGCALGIIKDNELVYAKGYGLANMEYTIPNSPNTVFRIGSTSKQFTAACIVLLAEKGKLSLDDNLKSLFPDFPDYAKKIRIKHLLNHTSGIRDYLQISYLKGLSDDDFYTDQDVMQWLVNQTDLNFPPGEEHLYSNSGYWLLGQIVQKVAGMNMAEFAQKELFTPLGMEHTHFHNDHTQIVKNRASGYVPIPNDGYKISMTTLDMIGDGGIFTTLNDIKKWDDSYYESKVLSNEFWRMMTQQGVLNNGERIAYASGLVIGEYKGLKTIRHGGAFAGFRAELVRFPEQNLSIALFANRGDANPSEMANQVADIVLKEHFPKVVMAKSKNEKKEVETPKEEYKISQLVGSYEIEPGIVLKLSVKNDTLRVVQTWNKSTYAIVKSTANRFVIPETDGLTFAFSNVSDGFTQTLTVIQNGQETKAVRKKEVDVSGVDLTAYVGNYYSKELDVTYTFKIENGLLKGRIKDKNVVMDCTPIDVDQVLIDFGLVRFLRTKGQITGLALDAGRVKNLLFQKK